MATSMNAMILKRLQNLCQIRPRQLNIQRNKHGFHQVTSAREIKACDEVFEEMDAEGKKIRRQPGAVRKYVTRLPFKLNQAVSTLLEKYPVNDLEKHSLRLRSFLKVRKHKLTPEEYEELIALKISQIRSREGISEVSNEDHIKLKERAIKKLKPAYTWSPMRYTGAKVIQYLGARLAGDYTAISSCLREINLRDPEFQPSNVFDFGSGLGTTVWATNNIWKKVDEYYCVDNCADMNTVARLLLQKGQEDGSMKLPVHFRTNMPSDKENKFDLVVCTYTLMELETEEERQKLVESLWNMTEKYLVIVEKGGVSGFKLMSQTRQHLLKLSEESKEGHIFSPCPHQEACPKITEGNSPCFFESKYDTFAEFESKQTDKEWYSYVIFKVGPKTADNKSFPRLVDDPIKRHKHTHCHLCCPDGKLRHIIFSASQHGKPLFKCTRSAVWGDMLPAKVTSTEEEDNRESHVNRKNFKRKLSVDSTVEAGDANEKGEKELSIENKHEKLSFESTLKSSVSNRENEKLSFESTLKSSVDNNENEKLTVDNLKESSVHDNEKLLMDNK